LRWRLSWYMFLEFILNISLINTLFNILLNLNLIRFLKLRAHVRLC
jgi:hypothetical protein